MPAMRRSVYWLLASLLLANLTLVDASATEIPNLRLALLKFGTANWEADVIKYHGLDRKYGFNLDIIPMASKQASVVALQGRAADMILGDWIWVSRQRNAGHPLTFVPYSRCVGGLVVPRDSDIRSLADLQGRKLGIAGGPVDRNWLMIQALAKEQYGIDLNQTVEKVFGAPPLLYKKTLSGELDAVINFWHYLAKLEAKGMRKLISMDDVVRQLGFEDDTPMLGYIFRQPWADEHPQMVAAMMAASAEAKHLLKTNDQEWRRLRPLLKARDEAEFRALLLGFRAGIPDKPGVTDTSEAAALYALLARTQPKGLSWRNSHTLADGTFYSASNALTYKEEK